jgi:hypothetical protein
MVAMSRYSSCNDIEMGQDERVECYVNSTCNRNTLSIEDIEAIGCQVIDLIDETGKPPERERERRATLIPRLSSTYKALLKAICLP